MANLFWKTDKKTIKLLETPFDAEEEYEKTVFGTSDLLEEIILLKRQVRGGNKPGIPDIIGIDSDGAICIIELKNKSVDASIIPQVLEYAIWAETNPDSIKSLWLEKDNKPDDVEINWESPEIRILIIAPSISRSTLGFVERINYPVDLIEIKRWVETNNQIFMVNKLEIEERKLRVRPVKGMAEYDESYYKSNRNKKSVDEFLKYVSEVENVIKLKGWNLSTKFNAYHCAFKSGFFNAFRIKWLGTKSFAFAFTIPQKDLVTFPIKATRYYPEQERAIFKIEPGKTKIKNFVKLMEYSYKSLGGN
jgi:hypothetical protein